MWKVLLIVLPLVLGSCEAAGPLESELDQRAHRSDQETMNTEEQRYKHLLYQIHGTVQKLLGDQQKEILQRFNDLTQLVESACGSAEISQQTTRLDSVDYGTGIEEITNNFFAKLAATGEQFVTNIHTKLTVMTADVAENLTSQLVDAVQKRDAAVLQNHLSTLATSQDLSELQKNLSSIASTATEGVKQAVSSLAAELDASSKKIATNDQVEEIKEHLVTVTSCSHRNDFDKMLAILATTEGDIDALADTLATSLEEQRSTCVSGDEHRQRTDSLVQLIEGLQASVDANANGIRGVESAVGKMDGEVAVRLAALQELAQDINNNTLHPPPPPPPTTTTTTTPRPTTTTTAPKVATPCLDSSFTGFGNFDVCGSAVRFRKCKALFMSYHCCRTCTDARRIPVMGPHRYLQASRSVPIIQALDFF